MKIKQRLKIAVQKSGRLNQDSMNFLASLGLSFISSGRLLIQQCRNFDIDILYVRASDIPEYVYRGIADFGIVGQDVLKEKNMDLLVVSKLDFGKCELKIAVPKKSFVKKPADLQGERIATSYPKLLRDYLVKEGVEAAIIPISGSVEVAPGLDLADAICDIVQSGATLRANNLKPIFTVFKSQAVLVESPIKKTAKEGFINKFKLN